LGRELWDLSTDTKEVMRLEFSWKVQKSFPLQRPLDKNCPSHDRMEGQMFKENSRFVMTSLKGRDTVAGWKFHRLSISKKEQKGTFKENGYRLVQYTVILLSGHHRNAELCVDP
jgi:hypothetical protein